MSNFQTKRVAITGAASGLGRALAIRLAQQGAHLALADKDGGRLEETLLACHSGDVMGTTLDVADRRAVEQFAADVTERHGGLDILINNAGVAFRGTVEESSYDEIAWVMDTNFWGVVHGCKAFLPLLQRSNDAHIVNISSLFGLIAMPTQSAYNASKFAVRGFTESLTQELFEDDITVLGVYPAGIRTGIVINSRQSARAREDELTLHQQREEFSKALTMEPEVAADAILKAIDKKQLRLLLGADAHKLDGLVRLLPTLYMRLVHRSLQRRIAQLAG